MQHGVEPGRKHRPNFTFALLGIITVNFKGQMGKGGRVRKYLVAFGTCKVPGKCLCTCQQRVHATAPPRCVAVTIRYIAIASAEALQS
jgi:hypothetical protein